MVLDMGSEEFGLEKSLDFEKLCVGEVKEGIGGECQNLRSGISDIVERSEMSFASKDG